MSLKKKGGGEGETLCCFVPRHLGYNHPRLFKPTALRALHPILPARTLALAAKVRLDHETKRNPSAECYAPFLGEDSRLGNIILGRADDN